MKTQMTLQEMAAELDRQSRAKRDFVTSTVNVKMAEVPRPRDADADPVVGLQMNGDAGAEFFPLTEHAHRQVGERFGIPAKHYDRLRRNHPDLLCHEATELMHREPQKRMIRTLDGNARAFVSHRFRRMENFNLAEMLFPTFSEFPGIQFESLGLTDKRLYIKAVYPTLEAEVNIGDPVQAGVVISNSEVGAGSLSVQPLILRLVCRNGMIANDYGMKRYHVGRAIEVEDENVTELLSDEALKADDRAVFLKVRDVLRGTLEGKTFEEMVNNLKRAAGQKIDPRCVEKCVKVTAKRFSTSEDERQSIFGHLIAGGDLSAWGLCNAVTRTAQDVESYDRATELERIGGQIIELPQSEWRQLAEAA